MPGTVVALHAPYATIVAQLGGPKPRESVTPVEVRRHPRNGPRVLAGARHLALGGNCRQPIVAKPPRALGRDRDGAAAAVANRHAPDKAGLLQATDVAVRRPDREPERDRQRLDTGNAQPPDPRQHAEAARPWIGRARSRSLKTLRPVQSELIAPAERADLDVAHHALACVLAHCRIGSLRPPLRDTNLHFLAHKRSHTKVHPSAPSITTTHCLRRPGPRARHPPSSSSRPHSTHMPFRGGCEVEGEEPANSALWREGQDVGCSAPLSSRMSSAGWPQGRLCALPSGARRLKAHSS